MNTEKVKDKVGSKVKSSGAPFVSIILPTHTRYPHFKEDKEKLAEMVKKAESYLDMHYDEPVASSMKDRVNDFVNNIDFNFHARSKGLGIFVSPDSERLIHFPFAVKEKIVVTGNFENKDLYLAESYMLDYCVLTLNEKHIRLFKCKGIDMKEVKDNNFPSVFVDEFEEPKPSRGDSWDHSLKGMRKDKSVIKEDRFTDFLRLVDKKLPSYFSAGTKLIISGGTKNISDFEKVSRHREKVIGKVEGDYNFNDQKTFSDLVWKQVENYLEAEKEKVYKQFVEAEGSGYAVSGIEAVWEAVMEGKGLTLLIEKDFSKPAFIGEDKFILYLHPPVAKHRILTDALDEIIEIILKKGGNVVFFDNGKLKDFGQIGLLMRYK